MLADWWASLRPWSFGSSLSPVLLGSALAYKSTGQFSFLLLLLACATVLALHAAGNLVNTYYDFVRGVDSPRGSDDRTLVDRKLTPEQVVHLGVWAYAIACAGFLALVILNPAQNSTHTAHLALVFFGGLTGSFVYTGGRFPLKYVALGDVLILIVFGPLSQLFAFMAQGGRFELGLPTLRYCLPLALGTEAILHSNNTRDVQADRLAGLVTLPILIGPAAAHVLFAALLFSPYPWCVCLALHSSVFFLLPLITLPRAFHIERDFRARRLQNVPSDAARLSAYAALFYVTALALTPAHQLLWLHKTTHSFSSISPQL